MVPSSHSVIVAKATPTSGPSYSVLGEGSSPKGLMTSMDGSGKPTARARDTQPGRACAPPYLLPSPLLPSPLLAASHSYSSDREDDRPTTPLLTYQASCKVDLCPQFHLAIDGQSFAVMRDKYPQEFQRVS